MMQRSLVVCSLLTVLAALAAPAVRAADVGILQRADCMTLTPTAANTLCFDQTTNKLKRWNGTAWVDIVAGEVVNVRHYGATGGGVVDDGQAIRTAAAVVQASGKGTLLFPKGDYLVFKEGVAMPS